ncbi:MAG: hypothetical protein FWG34_01505 [Oscillospiraceae bacterium]|nr:hypothetical protein [Oscillospiraceae bacterium]
MDTRERFVRVLTGKDADRVPFMKIFGGTNAISAHWSKQYPHINSYIDELLGFEGRYRGWQIAPVNTGLCGIPPDIVEYSSETETRVLHGDGRITVHMSREGHYFNHIAKYPVNCREDWRRVKTNWLDPDDPRRFPVSWEWKNYVEMFCRRDYPLQLTCGGVYGFARNMLGDETLCVMLYEDPELVGDIIATYIDMCIAIWKKMVGEIQFDIIECWEDMAYKNGSIISKKHFSEFLAPQYRRIRDFAGEAGIPLVMVDSDGNIMELAEWMSGAGVNCMYPFEAQSGNDVRDIRKNLPDMGCIGGLDKECMAKDKNAMDDELEKARKLILLGKFIPGPDHFVLENVPFENYAYFMRGLKRVVFETKF